MTTTTTGRCRWARAGGDPRTGLHAARLPWPLPDAATFDVLGTVALAGGTAWATGRPLADCLLFWFLLACVAHAALCVPTASRGLVW